MLDFKLLAKSRKICKVKLNFSGFCSTMLMVNQSSEESQQFKTILNYPKNFAGMIFFISFTLNFKSRCYEDKNIPAHCDAKRHF
jgi:hypothetical protein